MFGIGMGELLVILAIVVLLFGTKRLKSLGSDLGNAIKGFRSAVKDGETPPPPPNERVIEGEIDRGARATDSNTHKQDSNV